MGWAAEWKSIQNFKILQSLNNKDVFTRHAISVIIHSKSLGRTLNHLFLLFCSCPFGTADEVKSLC